MLIYLNLIYRFSFWKSFDVGFVTTLKYWHSEKMSQKLNFDYVHKLVKCHSLGHTFIHLELNEI